MSWTMRQRLTRLLTGSMRTRRRAMRRFAAFCARVSGRPRGFRVARPRPARPTHRSRAGSARSRRRRCATRARCDGFLAGFEAQFSGSVEYWRVESHGSFRSSLQASLDLLETQPGINVAFGVNDHAILAALEAARVDSSPEQVARMERGAKRR